MTNTEQAGPDHEQRPRRAATARRSLGALMAWLVVPLVLVMPGFDGPAEAVATEMSIAVGWAHSCAVLDDGSVSCWGVNDFGQLGDGTTDFRATPAPVTGLAGATSVSSGVDHNCAVLDDDTVRCWGYNWNGALGNGQQFVLAQTTPVTATGVAGVEALSAGSSFTCAVHGSGTISCWGKNDVGQLGNGSTTPRETTATTVSDIDDATAVSAGEYSACAVSDPGALRCWGGNSWGQLGDGSTDDSDQPVTVALTDVVGVAVGFNHACAALDNGEAWCWGSATGGKLGNGATAGTALDPVQVVGVSTAIDVAVTEDASCALLADASVTCWGENDRGEVGDGTVTDRTMPTAVIGLADVTSLDGSGGAFCAAVSSGAMTCWGENFSGQIEPTGLGINPTPAQLTSAKLRSLAIPHGGGHLCAIVASGGAVGCRGGNEFGQLGDGSTAPSASIVSTGLTGGADVAVTRNTSCARMQDQTVQCWGADGGFGTLGDGDDDGAPSSTPQVVSGLTDVEQIDGGQDHVCARLTDGTIECWGAGGSGQIGHGSTPFGLTAPSATDAVSGITDASDIATGLLHSCAIVGTGEVECWGAGTFNQLGNGGSSNSSTPVSVSGITDASSIDAGSYHTCAIVGSGSVTCWGTASSGQLGNGSTNATTTPVAVTGITDAIQLAMGGSSSCALHATGAVSCWGWNAEGNLGDGTTVNSTTPVGVLDIDDATALTGGSAFCAERDSGAGGVWCWGQNLDGELRAFPYRTSPTEVSLPSAVLATTTSTAPTTSPPSSTTGTSAPTTAPTTTAPTTTAPGSTSSTTTTTVPVGSSAQAFVSVSPARYLDNRPVGDTFDDVNEGGGRTPAGGRETVRIAGRGKVPGNATAVVMNLTAVNGLGVGYATAHPCLATAPDASSVNYRGGGLEPNEIIVKLDATGRVCVDVFDADTFLLIDVVGYAVASSPAVAVDPARYADSRVGGATVDDGDVGFGPVEAGETIELSIAGRGDVPDTATAAVVNLTVTRGQGTGFATVHPCLPKAPNASSINFRAGDNRPNELITKLDADGKICITVFDAATDLLVDVVGYLEMTTSYTAVDPSRFADTRAAGDTIDDENEATGLVQAGETYRVQVAGRGVVPGDATMAVVNLTVVNAQGTGFATVHPCLAKVPNASSINYFAGTVRPNELIAQLDADGGTCITVSEAATNIILDVVGHNG